MSDKVDARDSAQYEDLLAKRKAIDEAGTAADKAAASDAFAKAVIKYYYRAEKGIDITVPDNKIDFDYKDIIPAEALNADGTKYISGYSAEYKPIYTAIPEKASVYCLSYADNKNEAPKDHYFLFTYDGEKVDLTEFTFSNGENTTEQTVVLPGRYVSGETEIDIEDAKYKAKITTEDEVVHVSELEKVIGEYAISGKPDDTDTVRYVRLSSGSEDPVYKTDYVIDAGRTRRKTGFVVEDYSIYRVQERSKTTNYIESMDYSWVKDDGYRWFATDEETANAKIEELNEKQNGYRHYVSKEWDSDSKTYKYYIYQKQIYATYVIYGNWTTVDNSLRVTTSKAMYESIDCTYEEGSTEINYLKYYSPVQNGSTIAGQGTVLDVKSDAGYIDQQNYFEILKQYEASDLAYKNAEEALKRAKAEVDALTAASKEKRVDAEQALKDAYAELDTANVDRMSAFYVLLDAVGLRNMADEAYWDADLLSIEANEALASALKAYKDVYRKDPHPRKRTYTSVGASDEETYTYDGSDPVTVTSTLMAAAPPASAASATVLGAIRSDSQPTKTAMSAVAVQTTEVEEPEADTPETDNSAADQAKASPAAQDENNAPEKQEANQDSTKISDDNTAKAAAPTIGEAPIPWGWLVLIGAALAGVLVEEGIRRKKR